ncbi:ABC transporter permease [Branchiibius sp. NY16-3462-2]|uniref:ABC transporter permease n=1 Tax=Branchiibius sp. NY16-3462-2 TaxID=1807500 RepID=UPI000791E20A|nr:ABC transporter permease subunit [Branchiibius sp. NY16-3462-2]KYH45682.1 hypothetical protein AZH51_18395 [Branchiibius sp. NY16-3462-2]
MAAVTSDAVSGPASTTTNEWRYFITRSLKTLGAVLISGIILLILWHVIVSRSGVSPFIAKKPIDVWNYLTQDGVNGKAADHRSNLLSLLWVTLRHAAIGFVFGVLASVIVSAIFVLVRPVEFMFMPIAMLLRTVPLLAMAPVIYVIFGNGLVTCALIGTIVVFFPLLVNVTLGLRSVSKQSADLVSVYGGNRFTILRKVAVPTALPYFFAAMRIAVPGAITGAMLYEWLFTFEGMGAAVQSAKAQGDYAQIWAVTFTVTVVAIALYMVATFIESAVLAKWGPNAGKATGS